MPLGPVSAGGWPAGRRVAPAPCSAGTLHTLGKGQVPVRGQPARGDRARGLRSLLYNSGRSPGSFPSVGGRALRVGPSDPRVPDPELFHFSQKMCARTHTPGSFDLPTVLTGREGFPTLSGRARAQSWPSIEQRLRAGPWTQSHTQAFETVVKYTQHKLYRLHSF